MTDFTKLRDMLDIYLAQEHWRIRKGSISNYARLQGRSHKGRDTYVRD